MAYKMNDQNFIAEIAGLLANESVRPLILAGKGAKQDGINERLKTFASKYALAIQGTWGNLELSDSTFEYYAGRPGLFGSRHANIAVQTCDLLICIGARLDPSTVAFNGSTFGKHAKNIFVVDIDINEHLPDKVPKGAVFIERNSLSFINTLEKNIKDLDIDKSLVSIRYDHWISRLNELSDLFPLVDENSKFDCYVLFEYFSRHLTVNTDVIVSGSAGVQSEIFHQVFHYKEGQRFIADSSYGSMGYGLPASIGASVTHTGRTILFDGDGSIHPHIQELPALVKNSLNIKVIVINNDGYASIRETQQKFFNNSQSCSINDGLHLFNLRSFCNSIGLRYESVSSLADLTSENVHNSLVSTTPALIECFVPRNQQRAPRVGSSLSPRGFVTDQLENMQPYLDEQQLNQIVSSLLASDDQNKSFS